ncbi:uncharacterized protein LOC110229794 [Arabidopsis lyrata subsp. lyrata]|uniref:uncharacterized protein LOC110229794 n=1 Tax=Arabidopsis lyrata subsp. lyrata TaxID=81972 RepID=UPI000A29E03A|nr:uncharacterized protein LOC110229794 [Arabidopsis lyrata subsp. lyrata]XP_020886340.1 uncharacterized protein LOC110229794 [Arabidopsis lyrata subsp. lyrata]|eukprot:XP_020886339.1 uncharacterized protein LOC110229794 [Arabidopsis lyrata subsp. lyrata]
MIDFSESCTVVYWDLKDYPIPTNIDPHSIYQNIKAALSDGYRDMPLKIWAYPDKTDENEELNTSEEFFEAGFFFSHNVPGISMLLDILSHAFLLTPTIKPTSTHKPSNFMVISKSLPEDKETKRVLWALKSRGFDVHFAHHPLEGQVPDQMFSNPALLSSWTYPLGNDSTTMVNKHDFSERFTPSSDAMTCVFWDLVDCPFPNDLDPETIFQRIKSTLEEKGYRGGISIWAYAERIQFSDDVLDKYQKARIYFVPEVPGDKIARFLRMSHDIRLWEMDTYPVFGVEANVIVISNDINTQGKNINFSHYLIGMQAEILLCFLSTA